MSSERNASINSGLRFRVLESSMREKPKPRSKHISNTYQEMVRSAISSA